MFREMGTVLVRYKVDNRQLRLDTNDQSLMKNQEQNDDSIHLICSNKTMKICQVFQLAEKEIKWGIEIENINDKSIHIILLAPNLFSQSANLDCYYSTCSPDNNEHGNDWQPWSYAVYRLKLKKGKRQEFHGT